MLTFQVLSLPQREGMLSNESIKIKLILQKHWEAFLMVRNHWLSDLFGDFNHCSLNLVHIGWSILLEQDQKEVLLLIIITIVHLW